MAESGKSIDATVAIVGSDRSLRADALAEVIRQRFPDDDVDTTRLDGAEPDFSPPRLLDDLRMPSLFSATRIVIVDNADGAISACRKLLERYCSDPAEGSVLILLCNSLPKNHKIYKIIKANGRVIECAPPTSRTIGPWIVNRTSSRYGKRMTASVAGLLRDCIGDAPGMLDTELAKLAAFVGPRDAITADDVKTLTGRHRERNVFGITDAMAAGDVATALGAWRMALATDRSAPGRAIGGLAWGLRRLLDSHRQVRLGVDPQSLARKNFTDPDTMDRRLRQTGVEALMAQQHDLLVADLATKTGGTTPAVAVEKFIVRHAADRRGSFVS